MNKSLSLLLSLHSVLFCCVKESTRPQFAITVCNTAQCPNNDVTRFNCFSELLLSLFIFNRSLNFKEKGLGKFFMLMFKKISMIFV